MKKHIYSLLASERRRLRISQQELAARAGLRREKVNRVESKGEDISFEDLSRLLDAVGLEFAVRAKGEAPMQSYPRSGPPLSHAARQMPPQEFDQASFIDGSKVKVLSWGKVPR